MNIDNKALIYFAEAWRDVVVDQIEEMHFLLCTVMPIQEADLCWHYLVRHYYHETPIAEA